MNGNILNNFIIKSHQSPEVGSMIKQKRSVDAVQNKGMDFLKIKDI